MLYFKRPIAEKGGRKGGLTETVQAVRWGQDPTDSSDAALYYRRLW
jgi:hypothetical protein